MVGNEDRVNFYLESLFFYKVCCLAGSEREHFISFLIQGLTKSQGMCIFIARSWHVETVVLLSQRKPDDVIEVEIELGEMDLTSAESKATYAEIKDYVLKEHGLKVSNLYISQVKRKCGIEVGENYNLPKSEDSRQPQCPEEKEKAIKDALDHFGMI